jgi:hypothetical protein
MCAGRKILPGLSNGPGKIFLSSSILKSFSSLFRLEEQSMSAYAVCLQHSAFGVSFA